MIVLSLLLVIAAAVCLFIGLFLSEALTFIYVAIVLCLLSLLLLWLGSRAHRRVTPSEPSEPVYGGATRPGTTAAARPATGTIADDEEDDLDALTAPSGGVVTKTSARERAAARVEPGATSSPTTAEAPATKKASTKKKAATKKAATKKAATKKTATKKAATKKSSTRKAAAKKTAAKKTARRTAKKSSASRGGSSGRRTTGAAARSRLGTISGIGPSKQDALLERYGSIESIHDASVDDIVDNVKGFGPALAQRVKDELSS